MLHPLRVCHWLLACAPALGCLCFSPATVAQPAVNLQASLVPAITISGPLGSMQDVQYSTNPADSNSWTTLSFVRLDSSPKNYFDLAATGPKRFYRTKLSHLADTNLVWIPPGTFLMGSPETEEGRSTNEGPQTLVTFTYGFFMGRFEVRNIEWLAYMATLNGTDSSLTNYLQRPVRSINWVEATDYCGIRTAAELAAGLIPAGWAYRLPSEAEWEYACRAGTTTAFAFGNTLRNDDISHDANFWGIFPYPASLTPVNPIDSGGAPLPVGSYASNAFGLYDVHGNVLEWCLDRFDSNPNNTPPIGYPGGSVTNPVPVLGSPADYAALRGGGYLAFNRGFHCRSASRAVRNIAVRNVYSGLRVVLAPVNP